MVKKIGTYEIPFDKEGNQLHYADPKGSVWDRGHTVWKENTPFEDTLVFEGYARGRSAAYMSFRRINAGGTVVVFLKDFETMVKYMICGKITGTFVFIKRGQNYGCALVD